MSEQYFWLVRGKHFGAKWRVFETLNLAEAFIAKRKEFGKHGFELIQVRTL